MGVLFRRDLARVPVRIVGALGRMIVPRMDCGLLAMARVGVFFEQLTVFFANSVRHGGEVQLGQHGTEQPDNGCEEREQGTAGTHRDQNAEIRVLVKFQEQWAKKGMPAVRPLRAPALACPVEAIGNDDAGIDTGKVYLILGGP